MAAWFQNWFNTPYYHILYNNRTQQEANAAVQSFASILPLKPGSQLLDIGCGKGRHSLQFRRLGYCVTGIDISANSIAQARHHTQPCLRFFVHDMRKLLYANYFNYAVNLFSSFGYFSTIQQHVQALTAFNQALKPGGLLLIDYLNAEKVVAALPVSETIEKEGITFNIQKHTSNGIIYKDIRFAANGASHHHQEQVAAFTLAHFNTMLQKAGFAISQTYGNYQLQPYTPAHSERLILLCQKL